MPTQQPCKRSYRQSRYHQVRIVRMFIAKTSVTQRRETAWYWICYSALPQYGGKGGGRPNSKFGTPFPGWVEEVEPYEKESRYWHDAWVLEGRPRGNWLHGLMVRKRSQYHYAARRARKGADQRRAENLFEASLIGDCSLLEEMKKIRCGGSSNHPYLPDTVSGA